MQTWDYLTVVIHHRRDEIGLEVVGRKFDWQTDFYIKREHGEKTQALKSELGAGGWELAGQTQEEMTFKRQKQGPQ